MKYLTASLLVLLICVPAHSADRPNILLIVGDDIGYGDVGFNGCKDIPTPHLDALAASGVRFTHGYVSAPYCSPTRAGLLTGKYQQRFGHEFNPGGRSTRQGLPVDQVTLADRLKSAGYQTALVGKWHLGYEPEMHPQRRGFSEFFGFLGGGHDYFQPKALFRGNQPVAQTDYVTDAFAREASAFIERHKSDPWFLYLAFNAVHTPMQAPEDRLAKFASITDPKRRTYAAMMSAMDDAIAAVIAKLDVTGQRQRTLVCFISDNGGPTMKGTTTNASRNAPLRGSKRTTLEGGIRVPFLVSWPGTIKPSVSDKPVIQLDLHTTALAAAGVDVKPDWKLDGVSLLPLLRGESDAAPHEALCWRFGTQMAIRIGNHKLVRYDPNVETNTGQRGQPVTPAKLYDVVTDPGETKDLAATMPEKVKELQQKWDAWNATLRAPLFGNPDTVDGSYSVKNRPQRAGDPAS